MTTTTATATIATTMMMNPATGSVATLSEWLEDFASLTPEEWGGESFEDAGLIEVVPDGSGGWIEASSFYTAEYVITRDLRLHVDDLLEFEEIPAEVQRDLYPVDFRLLDRDGEVAFRGFARNVEALHDCRLQRFMAGYLLKTVDYWTDEPSGEPPTSPFFPCGHWRVVKTI